MRTVFLGTPPAAVPSLDALASISEVVAVLTQPDRPRGRSSKPVPPAVKVRAEELGIPVSQPQRSGEVAGSIPAGVDAAVLVAYGMLIRPEALALPARGFVNVHFSILPRWRGAAPVQHALLEGDARTGVTLIRLDEGLDTGPILSTWSTAIGAHENAGRLTSRLASGGAALLRRTLPEVVEGQVAEVAQADRGATTAPKIGPADRRLDMTDPAELIIRRIRALSPRPGAHATLDGRRFRILDARPRAGDLQPGELVADGASVLCGTGSHAMELVTVQPEGKPAMPADDWSRGRQAGLGRLE